MFTGSRRRIDLDHVFDKDDMVFNDKSGGLNYSSSVPSSFDKWVLSLFLCCSLVSDVVFTVATQFLLVSSMPELSSDKSKLWSSVSNFDVIVLLLALHFKQIYLRTDQGWGNVKVMITFFYHKVHSTNKVMTVSILASLEWITH